MRYAILILVLAQASSCSDVSRPSSSTDYLLCPTGGQMGAAADTGVSTADSSLFGSMTKASPYNCINDPTLCSNLGLVCDMNQGCCAAAPSGYCTKSSDCMDPTKPVCNVSANICVPCSTGTMQAEGNQQCQDWVTAHSDPLNRNLCINGLCAECLTDNDCHRANKMFCNQVTNICGGCTKNSDCPTTNLCKINASLLATGDDLTKIGTCAMPSEIAYVNILDFNCSSGDGTQTKPYCQISTALAQATPPSFIYVTMGNANAVNFYTPVTIANSGQRVAIIGPGRDVPYATSQAVLSNVTVSNGAQLTLMNLGVTNHNNQPAVQCSGSSTLYVNDVIIQDTMTLPKGGIYATNCSQVTIEKTKISHVNGYGVYILGGSGHRVINNAIINDGSMTEGAGLRIGGGAMGLFSFNTVASNTQSGITCDSLVPVTDSIVISNGAGMTQNQVTGSCQQARIVTTGVVLDSSYLTTGDPKLMSDTANQVIDQGMPDANMTIKDDYFGSLRPQGAGYDIGFQEVR